MDGGTLIMRTVLLGTVLALIAALLAPPARAFSDDELIDGFQRTVFGSEYQSFGWQSFLVKKFTEPVRVFVDDRSTARRGREVERFVGSLPGMIAGLNIEFVTDAADANYRVFVIDRSAYREVVLREIYSRPDSSFAPGKCLVRVLSTSSGITRSDAVIVADEGEFLFRRCMVEEVLQGFGPINDDRTLSESIFNDRSKLAIFTRFDQHILNMLYDPRIEAGMTKLEAARVLPSVIAEVRARLD